MAEQTTYYVRLVGIKAKEAILIESFLGIASNEGILIKIDKVEEHEPILIIVDELFHSDSLAADNPESTVVIIGDDVHYEAEDYLHRPLKWSTFEKVFDSLVMTEEEADKAVEFSDFDGESISGLTQIAEAETDEGLSGLSELKTPQSEPEQVSLSQTESPSMSQSEYSVSEFSISQIAVKEAPQTGQGNDYSESVSHSYSEIGTVIEENVELVEMEHSRVKAERTLFEGGGLVLGPNIVFWENFDCLMTVKSRPVLYILSSMGSVYSEYNYLDWGLLLKSKYARVYPLPKDWSAQEKLSKYPLSWLVWFSSIARSRGYLLKSVDKDGVFMLDAWPAFDQIYNDNHHLRLSSLLSTNPYNIQALVSKTRLPTKTIVAFLNACEKQGLLKTFATVEEALEKQKNVIPPQVN
ncbi:MAG: hypothetical protein ACRBEE_13135 [Arenicella sp.]